MFCRRIISCFAGFSWWWIYLIQIQNNTPTPLCSRIDGLKAIVKWAPTKHALLYFAVFCRYFLGSFAAFPNASLFTLLSEYFFSLTMFHYYSTPIINVTQYFKIYFNFAPFIHLSTLPAHPGVIGPSQAVAPPVYPNLSPPFGSGPLGLFGLSFPPPD